jgi:hypothetical protein
VTLAVRLRPPDDQPDNVRCAVGRIGLDVADTVDRDGGRVETWDHTGAQL